MNVLLKLVPTSFLIGAVAGPLAMFAFQYIKKLGGWIDSQPAWAKHAWMFVLTQAFAVGASVIGTNISCSVDMSASDCLSQLTPAILKGLIVQGAAVVSFKLKKANPNG